MDPTQSSCAVPDPLKVLILSGPLAKPDKDALKSYIQTNLQLLYPYREAKVDLCPLPNHSLRSRLEDLTKLSTFVGKHDKHDTLRYDWVLPLFYLPPLTEPMYMDIEEDAVNIVQSSALEAAKAAKHVLFTTVAQCITKPSIPYIDELNEEIKKLGTSDGSHLLNISLLLTHWNNPSHPQTYSFASHRIAQHIAFYEHKWDNEEKLGLYHLSEQTKNILPSDSEFFLEKIAKPAALYRPYLTQECSAFVKLQAMTRKVRVELDFRCAQSMAKYSEGFDHLDGIKISNTAPSDAIAHPPSIIDQAFRKLNTTLRGIPDLTIAAAALTPNITVGYRPGHSQLNCLGINTFRPSRVVAASSIASLTEGVEVESRIREELMPMGSDGIRRLATINGMWRLDLNRDRPLQDVYTNDLAVKNPFRRGRGRIVGEVVEPSPKRRARKKTQSAAVEDEDEVEDENGVLVGKSSLEPRASKRTYSAAFSAAEEEDEDEDDIPMAQRRYRLRHEEVILGKEIVRGRPAKVAEKASKPRRGPSSKYVKRRAATEKGPRRGCRKGRERE